MLDELSLVHDDPSVQTRLRVALSMVCRAESRKGSRLADGSRSGKADAHPYAKAAAVRDAVEALSRRTLTFSGRR
jgi:hypothetical protein